MLRRLAPIVCLAPLAGCELLSQQIDVPITIDTPPQEFDVGEAVAEAEGAACSDPESEACAAITAICRSDPSRNCDTPSLPSRFPAGITVPQADGSSEVVDANDLLQESGVAGAAKFQLAIPVDTASALEEAGVTSPDLAQSVSVEAFAFTWPGNSLTFDLPPLEIYISREAIPAAELDAQALIDSGAVTFVGRLGLNTDDDPEFEVGQLAGSTDTVPIAFEEAGKAAFNEAVLSGTFTLVTTVPEDYTFTLKLDEAANGDTPMLIKPEGVGKVGVQATFIFKVRATDVIELAQAAQDAAE